MDFNDSLPQGVRSFFSSFKFKALIVCVMVLLVPQKIYAQDDILIILSDDTSIYHDFYTTYNKKLNRTNPISFKYASETTKELLNEHKIIVSVGTKSASIINNFKITPPIIYTLISRDFYNSLINNRPCPGIACYSVYIEQPTHRYIQLISVLFDNSKTIAIPLTNTSGHNYSEITSITRKFGYKTKNLTISTSGNISRILENKLNAEDVLLALPDPEIYNRYTAKNIILTAYHKDVPIIAYSQAFAKAGALASLYSSIDDIADQTVRLTKNIVNDTRPIQKEYYPQHFSIEINNAVAHSLDILTPEIDAIKRKIK